MPPWVNWALIVGNLVVGGVNLWNLRRIRRLTANLDAQNAEVGALLEALHAPVTVRRGPQAVAGMLCGVPCPTGPWFCTRRAEHEGPHVATIGPHAASQGPPLARWEEIRH